MLNTNVFSANNTIKRDIYPATKTFILKHNSKAHLNSMWRVYQAQSSFSVQSCFLFFLSHVILVFLELSLQIEHCQTVRHVDLYDQF